MMDPDLEDLKNPDVDGTDTKYNWDIELQRQIISMLLVDKQFLIQSIDLIRPSYFTEKAHSKTCTILFEYFRKYKTLPKKYILLQELSDNLAGDKFKLNHLGEINSIYTYFEPGLEDREYLSNKIIYFAKMQAIKNAFTKSLSILNKHPEDDLAWSEIYELLRVAMNTDRNFEEGLKYFETLKERYERMNQEDSSLEKFITGWDGVDKNIKGGGYNRGEMISIIAASGVGKSVALSCMAATNVKRDKKVVYISLELSEDRVAERFDSIFTGASIHCLYSLKNDIFNQLEALVEDKKDKNLIVIKYFPGKTATVNTIRAYLTQLKFYGFVPDMVIVDYVGELKDHSNIPVHESRELLVGELRALANEGEKFFCATAMQTNRSAKMVQQDGVIEDEHMGDSYAQIRPLDGGLTLNQNKGEKLVNVGRVFVMKQRFGKSRYLLYVYFDPNSLKISEISQEEYKNKMNSRIETIADETLIDNIVKPIEYKPSDAEGETK